MHALKNRSPACLLRIKRRRDLVTYYEANSLNTHLDYSPWHAALRYDMAWGWVTPWRLSPGTSGCRRCRGSGRTARGRPWWWGRAASGRRARPRKRAAETRSQGRRGGGGPGQSQGEGGERPCGPRSGRTGRGRGSPGTPSPCSWSSARNARPGRAAWRGKTGAH